MDKRFVGALIAVIIILGGIFIFTSNKNNSGGTGGNSGQPTNHIEGLGQDKVTLVEYGDYECPFCGQYFPVVKQVQQDYNTQIFFQFRNLPLTQIHPNALAGARAAEAAGLMGKFWQMHDLLYQNQSSWVNLPDPDSEFVNFAQQLGLNTAQFQQDFAGTEVNNLINADLNQFPKDFKAATGSYDPNKDEATPTFFLDGKEITPGIFTSGPNGEPLIIAQPSLDNFIKDINNEIKKKGFTPPNLSTSGSSTTTPTGASQSTQ